MVEKTFDMCYMKEYGKIVGIDEVGRGALAGPVVAAAVSLRRWVEGLDDSKKLSKAKREELSHKILANADVAFGIATPTEVDTYNIVGATKLAMKRAYERLGTQAFVLIDGLEMGFDFPHKSVIKGDAKSASIAAASIVAKVFRDKIMENVSPFYKGYFFSHNVGYATHQHLNALKELGPTFFHRLTFAPVRETLTYSLLEKWKKMGRNPYLRLRNENIQLFN